MRLIQLILLQSLVFWLCSPRFSRYLPILFSIKEGDPLSPPEGEASQGEHPLTPYFVSYLRSSQVIAMWGVPERRGKKHELRETPRATPQFPQGFPQSLFF
jgi:hypothetical protein